MSRLTVIVFALLLLAGCGSTRITVLAPEERPTGRSYVGYAPASDAWGRRLVVLTATEAVRQHPEDQVVIATFGSSGLSVEPEGFGEVWKIEGWWEEERFCFFHWDIQFIWGLVGGGTDWFQAYEENGQLKIVRATSGWLSFMGLPLFNTIGGMGGTYAPMGDS